MLPSAAPVFCSAGFQCLLQPFLNHAPVYILHHPSSILQTRIHKFKFYCMAKWQGIINILLGKMCCLNLYRGNSFLSLGLVDGVHLWRFPRRHTVLFLLPRGLLKNDIWESSLTTSGFFMYVLWQLKFEALYFPVLEFLTICYFKRIGTLAGPWWNNPFTYQPIQCLLWFILLFHWVLSHCLNCFAPFLKKLAEYKNCRSWTRH